MLQPWQKRFIRGAFAKGRQQAALSLARGGGKSTTISAICAACLRGALGERRGDIVVCASSFEQARVVFNGTLAFLGSEAYSRGYQTQDHANRAMIKNKENGITMTVRGSDPRRLHGIQPQIIVIDEPAQIVHTQADQLYNALRTSLGKIPSSRLLAIGTRAASPTHFFSKMLASDNPAEYSQIHAAPEGMSAGNRRGWRKANPSLSAMPSLLAAMESEWQNAKRDTAALQSFKALRLNLGVGDVEHKSLIDAEVWGRMTAAPQAEAEGARFWGIDLGQSAAMSAKVVIFSILK